MLVKLRLPQLQHGLDGRDHAVAARFGEQRRIIALRLVGVGAREVDQLGPPHVEQARTGRYSLVVMTLWGVSALGRSLGWSTRMTQPVMAHLSG